MTNNWRKRAYQAYVTSGQSQYLATPQMFAERKPYIETIIKKYIPEDRKTPILDLGCGYGAFLYFLKQAGYTNLAGVDFSQQQVDLAHHLGIVEVSYNSVAETLLQTKDQSIGVILAMDLLEHLDMETLFATLDEIYRVLCPLGKILATVPNAEGLSGMRILFGDITHYTAFTQQSISQILKIIGFADVRCFENKPIVHGNRSLFRRAIWDMGTLPHRLLLAAETGATKPILTQTMLFVASKPA